MKPLDKEKNSLRLQVFLSRNGVCSRREAMRIIQDGRVKVDGEVVCEPSKKVAPRGEYVSVDGKRVEVKQYEYVMLHKPAGYVTTKKDRFAKKTVLDLLPKSLQHVVPAGRLDKDTEGLLLLSNDGDMVYRLTHPKFNVDKVYFVCVAGRLQDRNKRKVEKGIVIDGKKTSQAEIKKVKYLKDLTELMITIHEGRKRQIRLMFDAIGHRVVYLKRLSQGSLTLGDLKLGEWRKLTESEFKKL